MKHAAPYSDTDPRAMEVWLDLQRRMSPEQRFDGALKLIELARRISEAGVRAMYPNASEREVFLRAAARRLSRDWMMRAYGWDPEANGNAC